MLKICARSIASRKGSLLRYTNPINIHQHPLNLRKTSQTKLRWANPGSLEWKATWMQPSICLLVEFRRMQTQNADLTILLNITSSIAWDSQAFCTIGRQTDEQCAAESRVLEYALVAFTIMREQNITQASRRLFMACRRIGASPFFSS